MSILKDDSPGFFIRKEGCILRSGGAEGADTAFENGVRSLYNKEIYLPWTFSIIKSMDMLHL